jgi:hypothetical protein
MGKLQHAMKVNSLANMRAFSSDKVTTSALAAHRH